MEAKYLVAFYCLLAPSQHSEYMFVNVRSLEAKKAILVPLFTKNFLHGK